MSVQHARHVGALTALWVNPHAQITNDGHWLDDTTLLFTVMDLVGEDASQS